MSSSKITVLNCGASQLALGVFSDDGSEPVLERLVVRDLDYDFSEEEHWLSATLGALRTAVSEAKVSGEIQVILPGFLLLSKTLRIAHVEGPKQAQMIAMLEAPGGATIPEIAEATGWQQHTVRGAIAGALKKRLGLNVASEKDPQRGRIYRIAK